PIVHVNPPQFRMVTLTVRLPQFNACCFVGICKSILRPIIFPPVSPAIAFPYPSTWTLLPSGITLGSTAITFAFLLALRLMPVLVIPEHLKQSAVYALASIIIDLPSILFLSDVCSTFLLPVCLDCFFLA